LSLRNPIFQEAERDKEEGRYYLSIPGQWGNEKINGVSGEVDRGPIEWVSPNFAQSRIKPNIQKVEV